MLHRRADARPQQGTEGDFCDPRRRTQLSVGGLGGVQARAAGVGGQTCPREAGRDGPLCPSWGHGRGARLVDTNLWNLFGLRSHVTPPQQCP